ncbi:MAG: hypothetical protein IJ261_01370, partial [Clostridia bacterium]|nr:hypothetical protein [Clostridia bacterium]
SLDIMLGAGEDMIFNWGDVITGRCPADSALTPTAYGPMLLCAPKDFEHEYTAEAMQKLASEYEERFDYMIFDSPAGVGMGFKLSAAAANAAIIVATPDEVCVRNGAIAADNLAAMGIEQSRLIINRFDVKATLKRRLLNIDDVIDSTRLRLLGIVEQDSAVSFNMSRGKPLPPRSSAVKAFARIAGRLDGKRIPLKLN